MRLQRRKVGNFCILVVKLAPILHNNHSTCWNTFVPTWRHGTQTITPCDSFTTLPAIIPPTNQASQVHKYKYKTAADWSSNNHQPCQVQTWTPDVTNPKAKQHIQSNLETPQILYRNQRETPTKETRPIRFVCGDGFWLQCATKSGENRRQWGNLWKWSMWAAFSGCILSFSAFSKNPWQILRVGSTLKYKWLWVGLSWKWSWTNCLSLDCAGLS